MQLIGIICNFVNEELGKSLSIKLKSFKVMKKKIIMACLTLNFRYYVSYINYSLLISLFV